MQEIVERIFKLGDIEAIKNCSLVCQKWRRIIAPLVFRQVLCRESTPSCLDEVLASDLSEFVRVISIMLKTAETMKKFVGLITPLGALQRLKAWPKTGGICQHCEGQFVSILEDAAHQSVRPIFPSLQRIQIISTEEPYELMNFFDKLERLNIDAQAIRVPGSLVWPYLKILHLRGTVDVGHLERFLHNHQQIERWHLEIVSLLRPIGDSPSQISNPLRIVLNQSGTLDTEAVESVLQYATEHADGHERSWLRHLHHQLNTLVDEEKAVEVRENIIEVFRVLLSNELDLYLEDIGNMQWQPAKLQVSFSIQYFWKDAIAIRGIPLRDNGASASGLWRNDEIKDEHSLKLTFR